MTHISASIHMQPDTPIEVYRLPHLSTGAGVLVLKFGDIVDAINVFLDDAKLIEIRDVISAFFSAKQKAA